MEGVLRTPRTATDTSLVVVGVSREIAQVSSVVSEPAPLPATRGGGGRHLGTPEPSQALLPAEIVTGALAPDSKARGTTPFVVTRTAALLPRGRRWRNDRQRHHRRVWWHL